MFKVLSVGLAVFCSIGGAATAGGERATKGYRIEVRILHGRFVVVPVGLNGTGPYSFLMDTGATSTMLTPTLAARLGLRTIGVTAQETATDSRPVDLVRASVSLGPVARRDLEVIATSLDAVRELDAAIEGVLGQDVLRSANWWLDYRDRILIADAAGSFLPHDLGEPVLVRWQADRPTVDVVLPDRTSLRLVLDSAASSPLLFRDAPDATPDFGLGRLRTHSGEATAREVRLGPLRVGGLVMQPVAAFVMASAGPARSGEDGLLPTGLFEGVYFDNRSGAVVFNPRRSARR
jgi:Aspartyl protease